MSEEIKKTGAENNNVVNADIETASDSKKRLEAYVNAIDKAKASKNN